jgi:hypothetical protein
MYEYGLPKIGVNARHGRVEVQFVEHVLAELRVLLRSGCGCQKQQ